MAIIKVATILNKINNKYTWGTLWIISEKVIHILATLLASVLAAKALGPEKFGVLSYGLSLVGIFAITGHLGLSGLAVRDLVMKPKISGQILGTVLGLKVFGYLLGFLLFVMYSTLSTNHSTTERNVLMVLSSILLFKSVEIIEYWFQSQVLNKYISISKIFSNIVSTIVRGLIVFFGASAVLFAMVNVLYFVFLFLFLCFFYFSKSGKNIGKWCFSLADAKEFLSKSWMIYAGSIFAVINLKIDNVMIKWTLGSEAVGKYAVASTLSEAWYFVPIAIVTVLFPRLIKLKEINEKLYAKKLQQLFDLLMALSILVAISITVVSSFFIEQLYGHQYLISSQVLVVHIWGGVFIFMRSLVSKWILIEEKYFFSMFSQGLGAIMNILLNLYLIPKYGIIGAAYATVVSYAFSSYFALLIYQPAHKLFLMMSMSFLFPLRLISQIIKN